MRVPETDMMDIAVNAFIIFAAVSLPVMYLTERKYSFPKKLRIIHAVCAVLGILSLAAVFLLFRWRVAAAVGDVRGWACDFFYHYFTSAVVFDTVLSALLCVAAAIGHPMSRIRMSVAILLPWVMIAVTLFVSFLASDGQFAADFYIKALAPGLGLLPHAVPMCERREKSE